MGGEGESRLGALSAIRTVDWAHMSIILFKRAHTHKYASDKNKGIMIDYVIRASAHRECS